MRTLFNILGIISTFALGFIAGHYIFPSEPTPAPVHAQGQIAGWNPVVTIVPNIVVDNVNLTGHWRTELQQAINYIDPYTTSHIRIGRCNASDRCITIKLGSTKGDLVGICNPCGLRHHDYIVIRSHYAGYTANTRRLLIAHELGHAEGLGHSPYHNNLMYPNLYYRANGHYYPHGWNLTNTQRKELRNA